jgi:hypothetical protein
MWGVEVPSPHLERGFRGEVKRPVIFNVINKVFTI